MAHDGSARPLNILNVSTLIFLMALWGGSFVAIKISLKYLNPIDLVLARFIPSAAMLLPLGLWASKKSNRGIGFFRSLTGRQRIALITASFFAVPAYHFCLNFGETLIPAGWASLVIALNPASIILFATVLLKEPIGIRRWAGIVLAFSGLVLIALTHDLMQDDGGKVSSLIKIAGILITTGAVISWGGFTVISKKLISTHHPFAVLAWAITLGTLMMLPALRVDFIRVLLSAPPELWWSILYLSLGCTVIAFALWFRMLRILPASQAGAFIYLVPLFALIGGKWLLNEPLDLWIIVGTCGVLGGVLLAGSNATRSAKRKNYFRVSLP